MKKETLQQIFFGLLLLAIYACYSACQAKGLYVVDGDSLEMGQERVRLYGIDAPEYVQYCYDAQGQKYQCGLQAKDFLTALVQNEKLSCQHIGTDRYGRSLKECFLKNGESLNRMMVASGWAVDYAKVYLPEEQQARRDKKGVWQGKFMRPELFRALQRKQEKNKKR